MDADKRTMRSSLTLSPASSHDKFATRLCDVVCEYASVSPVLAGSASRGVLWQATPGRFIFDVPGIARYLVEEGKHITIDAAPFARPLEIERFLRMTPLAALRWQRGRLAFHAATVLGPKGAVLIGGDSGCGKSALLTGLLMRGWTMLADDISLPDKDVRGRWSVLPTHPEIMLWPDTLEHLRAHFPNAALCGLNFADLNSSNIKTIEGNAALTSIHTGRRRFALQAERFASAPGLLRGIYWLSHHADYADDGIQVLEMKGVERFKAIGSLAYNTRIADALLDREAYFEQALSLAHSVPVWRLRRPRGRWSVEELATRIAQEQETA